MIYPDGGINKGNWIKGNREGINYNKKCNGDTYNGIFKRDVPNGFGVETLKVEQTLYSGFMKNGLKHGKGTLNFKDGTVYKGEF